MEHTISEAKKSLEGKILSSGYVTSVGTRQRDGDSYIRVGVLEEKNVAEIEALLTEGKWNGYNVEVIVRPPSMPHAKTFIRPMTKESISASIMDAFRVMNSKPNHSLDRRWLQKNLYDKLNPKECELIQPAIDSLAKEGIIEVANQHGAMSGYFMILTQKGYEEIYPIHPQQTIEKIGSAIMGRFRETNSKPNHVVDNRWLTQILLPKLNPRERDYVDSAIEDLVQQGHITKENRHGFCLVLTQTGYDQLY